MGKLDNATRTVRRRYDRIAPLYDRVMGAAEGERFNRWRALLWKKVEGREVLEIGVGTGQNFRYAETRDRSLTAVDLSKGMLERACERAAELRLHVDIFQMDIQNLVFGDDSFDSVIGSFLFCSVPDPLRGLEEVRRVCRPGGKVVLLEHGLSEKQFLSLLMRASAPLISWISGAEHIERKIEEAVPQSGLELEKVTRLESTGIFKLIEARKVDSSTDKDISHTAADHHGQIAFTHRPVMQEQ